MPASLLIVEDDAAYGRSLRRALEKEGHDVSIVASVEQAKARFVALEPEVVLIDYQLPDGNGLDLLDTLKPQAPMTVFLINTAYPDLDIAVDAMRRGASDFLAKDRAMAVSIVNAVGPSEEFPTAGCSAAWDASGACLGQLGSEEEELLLFGLDQD